MRLTIVGCSGSFPGPDSPCSAYLVEADGFRLLLDLGSGALGALQRHVSVRDIDALVLSHLHGDHWLDAAPYAFVRSYHPAGPLTRLPVYAPGGAHERLSLAQGGSDSIDRAYDVTQIGAGRREIGPFTVTFIGMSHSVETYGVRLEAGGQTLAYSADTGRTDALVDLARDADLFLCEATFLDGEDNPLALHLTGGQAGSYAARAGARRLVLTHLVPWGDRERTSAAAAAAYDGPLHLAGSGAGFEV